MATQTPGRNYDKQGHENEGYTPPNSVPSGDSSDPRSSYSARQSTAAGNSSDPRGDKVADRDSLSEQEATGASGAQANLDGKEQTFGEQLQNTQRDGSFYKHSANTKPKKIRGRLRNYSRRKVATLATIGLLGGGGIFGVSVLQAPVQIIDVAQSIRGAHFGNQERAGDIRAGNIYRYLRSGNDVGETRIGHLESKRKARMIADLEKIGLKPDYGSSRTYRGFTIDTANPQSPYYGMDVNQIKSKLAQKKIKSGITTEGNTVKVSTEGVFSGKNSTRMFVKDLGYGSIVGPMRARALDKYGLANWHPLTIADRKLNEGVSAGAKNLQDRKKEWKEKRDQTLRDGVKGADIKTSGATLTETDAEGNETTTSVAGEDGNPSKGKISETLTSVRESGSLKVTGGVAAAVGIVCSAKEVNDNIGMIRFLQVVKPLARVAMNIMTIGFQIMSGQDIDMEQVGFVAEDLKEVDKDGKVISTVKQSKAYRAEEGKEGGKDIDPATKELLTEGSPDWLNWTESGSVGALCSGVGQAITGGVSIVIGVLSGGTISTAAGIVTSALAGPIVIDKLSTVLSGEAVDVTKQGAERGNYFHFGGRIAGNSNALLSGGTKLPKVEEILLDGSRRAEEDSEFASKSFATKIFDINERKSLASTLISDSPPITPQLATSITESGANILPNLAKSSLFAFSGRAHAAVTDFDYGFEEIGISQADLDREDLQNPYDNADKAAAILTAKPEYIQKASDCFGVKIEKGVQGWGVKADPEANGGEGINPYDDTYDSLGCADRENISQATPDSKQTSAKKPGFLQNITEVFNGKKAYAQSEGSTPAPESGEWTRIRFFIMDTGVMNGLACYDGDDESCEELGIGVAKPQGSTESSNPLERAGASVDVSKIREPSDTIDCADGTKDLGVADGYTQGSKVKIRLCAVSNIKSSGEESNGGYGVSGANGKAVVNSRVSGAFYAMAEAAKKEGIDMSANSSFRSMAHQQALCTGPCASGDYTFVAKPGTSNHQLGVAIDFSHNGKGGSADNCDGGRGSNPCTLRSDATWKWLTSNAKNYDIKQYSKEFWHWSPLEN